MHDIKFIRENPELFDAALKKRYLEPLSEKILSLDAERRKKIFAFETVKARQNELSKEIGTKRNSLNYKDFEKLRGSLTTKKLEMNILENESKDLDSKLNEVLLTIPNSPDNNVQVGKTEKKSRNSVLGETQGI
jgi:seryl-tRNA synthetase